MCVNFCNYVSLITCLCLGVCPCYLGLCLCVYVHYPVTFPFASTSLQTRRFIFTNLCNLQFAYSRVCSGNRVSLWAHRWVLACNSLCLWHSVCMCLSVCHYVYMRLGRSASVCGCWWYVLVYVWTCLLRGSFECVHLCLSMFPYSGYFGCVYLWVVPGDNEGVGFDNVIMRVWENIDTCTERK